MDQVDIRMSIVQDCIRWEDLKPSQGKHITDILPIHGISVTEWYISISQYQHCHNLLNNCYWIYLVFLINELKNKSIRGGKIRSGKIRSGKTCREWAYSVLWDYYMRESIGVGWCWCEIEWIILISSVEGFSPSSGPRTSYLYLICK